MISYQLLDTPLGRMLLAQQENALIAAEFRPAGSLPNTFRAGGRNFPCPWPPRVPRFSKGCGGRFKPSLTDRPAAMGKLPGR